MVQTVVGNVVALVAVSIAGFWNVGVPGWRVWAIFLGISAVFEGTLWALVAMVDHPDPDVSWAYYVPIVTISAAMIATMAAAKFLGKRADDDPQAEHPTRTPL